MPNQFSANNSILGYLYQIRYALYILLKKFEQKSDIELSIENLDDVAFEEKGEPIELLQLKHHIKKVATLTDGSSDLWKSIRIWCEAIKKNTIVVPNVMLTLITTGKIPENTIASLLKTTNRDADSATKRLLMFAKRSTNEDNRSAYEAFISLTNEQRIDLVRSIHIIDCSPNILNIEIKIKSIIKIAVRPKHLDPLYERLEGWWLKYVIKHLIKGSLQSISGYEVQAKINDISEQLQPEALPIDFLFDQPDDINARNDDRVFIQQLRLIALKDKRIEIAIRDYYRAFQQRSRWVREELLSVDELEIYEKRLSEEWERYFAMINEDEIEENDELKLIERGKKVYNWMDLEAHIAIRRDCTEPYVMRGSFHILANGKNDSLPLLGWHPYFLDRLKQIIKFKERVG